MNPPLPPRPFHPGKTVLAALALGVAFGLAGWMRTAGTPALPDVLHLDGRTMGTVYRVRVVLPADFPATDLDALGAAVEERLAAVEKRMSVWDPDSEISRFNAHASTEPFPVSDELAGLVSLALEVAAHSNGAFDPTVGPLVDFWGFGPDTRSDRAPDPDALASVRARVGYARLSVSNSSLRKARPDLRLDLGAIAKGHGVDAVARWIAARGFTDFLVEIGGDLYAAGRNARGDPWRIGLDRPALNAPPGRNLYAVMGISGFGMATSGDYRNYRREPDGRVYAHIIDPRIGQPVQAPVSSVTVLASDAARADALATALFVLGPEAGVAWLQRVYPEADALFLVCAGADGFREYATPDFFRNTAFRRDGGGVIRGEAPEPRRDSVRP